MKLAGGVWQRPLGPRWWGWDAGRSGGSGNEGWGQRGSMGMFSDGSVGSREDGGRMQGMSIKPKGVMHQRRRGGGAALRRKGAAERLRSAGRRVGGDGAGQ